MFIQITSLIDIGTSLLSQFNKLTYEFMDNSGFDIDPNDQKEDNLYQPVRLFSIAYANCSFLRNLLVV